MAHSNTALGRGTKGSKYWMQNVVENPKLRTELEAYIGEPLVWISPLLSEDFREYQLSDKAVREKLGITESESKRIFSFWPQRQPQWDAIATSADGTVLYIFEAKAHIYELLSRCSAKNPESIALITNSMKDVFDKYFSDGDFEAWTEKYYQLGNRLTYLKKLNEDPFGNIKGVRLVLLNFVNDISHIPTKAEEWTEHYKEVFFKMIGNENAPSDTFVICFDVKE